MPPTRTRLPASDLEQMRADAVLPDDVQPSPVGRPSQAVRTAWEGRPTPVLLTGATGFVGAHLLHILLRETQAEVVCLVRPDRRGLRVEAGERIRRNLEAHGLWEPAWAKRIRPIAGDLRRPGLGWSQQQHEQLAESLAAIYHGAAAVNWVTPYAGLRAANVLGTLELLRLACRTRAKPFHFLSTIGVCYATSGRAGSISDRSLTETDDPWPLLDRLHLGYAQSKSVAEQLVQEARRRGLPTVIYRPTLITGDSRTGTANPEDFLARGLGACVRMGCAPDVDWSIDACPVDHVARVVVRHSLKEGGAGAEVLHLVHPQPRHWRELVLWMRLYGYPLRLVSFRDFLQCLEETARVADHPLHPLLGFFRARVGGVPLPETYLGRRRTQVSAERTRQTLVELGESCPALDARWLERYFGSLTTQGVVPPLGPDRRQEGAGRRSVPRSWTDDCLLALLRQHFDDPALDIQVGPSERLSQQSILTELTSWRCGSATGLFRQRLELQSRRLGVPDRLDVVVKVKTEDRHLLDVIEASAALCDRDVGAALGRWRDRLGFSGGNRREIALYGQDDDRWRRLTPRAYGVAWDEQHRQGLVVLEDLGPAVWIDPCVGTTPWRPEQIEAVVRSLAELHAIWFGRRAELAAQPWLGPQFTASGMAEMADLWTALADYAARFFVAWLGPDVRRLQRRLLNRLEQWWRPLEQLPQTLIHNDFNPRNLGLRRTAGGPVLCAFDWELATLGVPQHDLAEFLCFVLPFDCSRETVQHYLDLHRQTLERAAGCRLDAVDYRHGFGLALGDLLVNRWALYTLVHTVRRQPFLERVLHTWRTLFADFDPLGR